MAIGFFHRVGVRLGPSRVLQKIPLTRAESVRAASTWGYGADHLPVFGRVDDLGVGTLNMLNNAYVHHLEKVEGWKESQIVQRSRIPSDLYPEISAREEEICKLMERLFLTEPCVDLLCLQEVSDPMHRRLALILEPRGIAVVAGNGGMNNHVVTLVNTSKYCIKDVQVRPIFQRYIREKKEWYWDQWRPAVDVTIESKVAIPSEYRIVNSHISSAGQDPKYKEDRLREVDGYLKNIDAYLKASQNKEIPVLLAGDLNACKTITYKVFNSRFNELCEHYTQIECIPVDHPHLVSIDSLMISFSTATKPYHAAFPIPLHKTTDREAAKTHANVIAPILASRGNP